MRAFFKNRLSHVDFFHFSYLVFLLATSVIYGFRRHSFADITWIYILLLLLLILLIYLRTKISSEKLYFWLYFWYPVIFLLIIFQSMSWFLPVVNLPAIETEKFDTILYSIDSYFYDIHPVIWFARHARPIMTDIMYLFYSYYYFMPLILMTFLILHKKQWEVEKAYFILIFSFYLGYIGYMLVPARGPRFYMDIDPVQGVYIAENMRNLLNFLEANKHDVFPSMHQLIVVVILILSFRYERPFFYFSLPFSFGITISLMYCQYHYVIDVIAGTAFAFVFYFAGDYFAEKYSGYFCHQFTIKQFDAQPQPSRVRIMDEY
ncbi:phosphatase PAP2 family protein [candidate division KSB1 bacterium]|nr:phosphatase PAP2 family protein [candidate division KSB1 bacterium]